MPIGQADRLMPTLRRVVLARQAAARSDGELLGAFVASRDADAFAELVRRHGPMVLGVCRRVVGDRAAADDAFQAVFLVLVRRAAAVRPREQVGNWLYGVAYRTALKARMVLARRRSREKQVDVMPERIAPPTPPAWGDLQPVIDEELARLPDRLRVPVVLCDLEGRSQREVARHLNVPPATLATRLASARRTLAQRLTRRGVALSGGALAGLLGTHASAPAVPPALAAGLIRAVEVAATGGALHSVVSANAVHLSEGVMRMMMLGKLKAVAVMTVTVLALTTGLGLGLVPAAVGDEPVPGSGPAAKPAPGSIDKPLAAGVKGRLAPDPAADDATFLRRLCLDARGTPPTDVETWFFVSDDDADKRAKLVEWLTDDDAARALLAKKLGVAPDRIRVLRVQLAPDGKRLVAVADGKRAGGGVAMVDFDADGKMLGLYTDGSIRREALWTLDPDNKNAPGALSAWIDLDGGPEAAKKVMAVDRLYTLIRREAVDEKTGKRVVSAGPADSSSEWSDVVLGNIIFNEVNFDIGGGGSDEEFLNRVLTDVRGGGPTALERKYFTEDKDPRKREKLLDTLLKDPAIQKKLGDEWKAKMLAAKPATDRQTMKDRLFLYFLNDVQQPNRLRWEVIPQAPTPPKPPEGFQADGRRLGVIVQPSVPPVPPTPAAPQAGRLEKLVGDLITAQKSDEAILEALTLATLSRLPTDNEKKIVLASIGSVSDRKAAWVAVAKALAGTEETTKPKTLELKMRLEPPPAPPKP